MSAGQMTAFSALVSVCSGLGSIVTLLVLLAILAVGLLISGFTMNWL